MNRWTPFAVLAGFALALNSAVAVTTFLPTLPSLPQQAIPLLASALIAVWPAAIGWLTSKRKDFTVVAGPFGAPLKRLPWWARPLAICAVFLIFLVWVSAIPDLSVGGRTGIRAQERFVAAVLTGFYGAAFLVLIAGTLEASRGRR